MDERQLQEIYNSIISRDPSYKNDISFDVFKQKMSEKEYQKKITSWLGVDTPGVKVQTGPLTEYQKQAIGTGQPKPKDKIGQLVSDINSGKVDTREWSKAPEFLDKQLQSVSPELLSQQEEFVVPKLKYQFGPLGFKFEEFGAGDNMKVTSPDNKTIEVSLDDNGNVKDTERLRNFLKYRSLAIPNLNNFEKEYQKEKTKITSEKEASDSISSFSKRQDSIRATIKGIYKQRDLIQDQIDDLPSMQSALGTAASFFGPGNEKYTPATEDEKARLADLMKKRSELDKKLVEIVSSPEYKSLQDDRSSLSKSIGEYTMMKSQQGDMTGAIFNSALMGIGRMGADVMGGMLAQGAVMFGEQTGMQQGAVIKVAEQKGIDIPSYAKKDRQGFDKWFKTVPEDLKKELLSDANDLIQKTVKYGSLDEGTGLRTGGFEKLFREAPKEIIGDKNITKEYEDLKKSEFWAGSILGLAESAPAFLMPGGWAAKTAAMFTLTEDYVKEEMSKDPDFEKISESEKSIIVAPYAIASAALETIGIRNVLASKGLLNNIIYRALNSTAGDISSKSFAEFIKNDVKSGLARGTLTLVGASLAEAETGASQRAIEIGIKEIYNSAKGKEMFKDLPKTFSEIAKDVIINGAQEAVGGGILGSMHAVSAGYKKQGFLGMEDAQFKMFEAAAKDPVLQSAFIANLKSMVNSGEITMEEAKETLNNYRNSVGLFNAVPEDLSANDKKKSMNLLKERRDLERQIEGKDPALVAPITERIKSINESLTKLSQNAVQEQATNESLLRQEGSQVGLQEMVQGDQGAGIEGAQQGQEQAAAAPAPITGLSISDPEVDTRVTDEKQKGVLSFARKAVSAISSIMPGVEFIVHDNSDSYTEAVSQRLGKESKDVAGTSGYFTYGADGSVRIDIDLTNANSRTVAHEVAHAVLYKKFNEDFALFKDFKNRLSGVVSSMAPQDFVTEAGEVTTVKEQLADFVSRYEGKGENVKAEEFITELSAMLTSNEAKISTSGWNKISTFIGDFVSKITGGKINLFEGAKTTRDVVDFFNSMSKAIATGEDVSGINFARKGGQAPATGQVTQGGKASISDEDKYKPLPGAPTKAKDIAGPDTKLVSVAEQYAKENGIDFKRQGEYVEIDEAFSKRIAQAFEDMKHDPSNEKVKEAYSDLIRQTRAQYDALIKAGYEFSFFDSKTDPYKGNPSDAMRDLRSNKKMAVYGTYDGYGTEGITAKEQAENPLLEDTGLRWKDQNGVEKPVTANDLFRAVHDAFGHGLEGAGFRARGEENAWQAHVRLFQGPAVGAITTETRGQNSWLNFGPYGEKNRTAKIEDTVFGEQKIGLMPEWTWTEGRSPDYEAQKEKKPEVKGKASVLSNYRDNKRFKFSDLKYPDTVLGNIKEGKDVNTAINFYEKIVRVFNKTFDRDVKVYSEKSKNNFGVTVEYETGLKPKYFSYPTSKMGEHVVVDKIDKFTPLTSLRHELIHEMLVKNITDKFERINEMDQSAVSESIENVQRNRAYNYSLEDVFFERVVENIERLPDNKDTFPIETYAQDVVNRLVSELNNESPSKEDVNAKLDELLEGSTPWLSKNLKEAVNAADFGKPLKESVGKIGKYFLDRFTVSKDIFPKELQEKIFKFTEVFNDEYQGVLTRLKSTEKAKPEVKGKASRTEPLITDKKILSQMTEDNDGNFLFYHVSPSRISGKIDPKFFGRNLRTGRDERPGIGISMYYTRPDRADVSGEYKYVAAIPKDKVYPFNSDPLDLYDKAKASFEKMYPGQAFDPNKQVAFISREAEKLGYQMTVAKWGDGLRAQTTKAIRPEWLERPNGNKVEVNEKFKDFKANSKTAVKGKASMTAANTEESNRSIKQEFVDEVNKASIDKFGEPYFPSIDNPNVVVLTSSEVDKLENEKCKSNKCETNTYKLVKENPDKYYPVRGYFVNKNNYPVEHWWLYDRQSKKYLEITPDENENVPKDYIKGYVGVVNKNINEEIVNSNKVFDVDFFQSNQRREFKKIISEENAAAGKPAVKGKASRMAPENEVSEKTLPGYDSLVAGIAKYVSNAISRGDAKADIVRTAVDIAQSSPIYESANDVQREQIVREARKAAGASQKSSPSVSRLFGIKPKDVTMTELQALNKQISDLAKGARESKNDINERRRNLSDAVRKLAASGNVSAKKVAAIINKISNLNLYNTKKVNEFIQYATNVFADADYAEKLSIANATRKQIKKLSKSADKFANLRDLGSRFSEIDPSLVSDIDEYNNIASLVKESIKGSTVRGTDPVFARIANEEQVNEYISDTIDSQDQQLLDAKIEEAQDLLGFDATGMTYDEILELLEPNKTIAKDVENIIRAGINKAFDIYKTIINDILSTGVDSFTGDPVNYTENQKRVISEFININPGDLKIKNALEAVDALVNFITNGSIAKMESVVERYNGEQNMIRANRNGLRASPLRKYGSKLFGQLLVEQTASLNIIFERMFGGFTRGGFMEKMMGITDIKNGVSKAKSEADAVVKKYVEMFYDKKANGQDFNTAYNNIERGMIAFLVKGIFGTQKEIKAEFDRRKNLATESINQLEKGNDQEKAKAKIYQEVFDKIAQNSSTAQDVINAADRTNLDAVEFWVDNWIDRYQKLSDVALGIYNKVLGRDVNYTPDRFSKLSYGISEVDMSSEDMSFIFNSGNASFYKKETGVLMKATKPDTLPSERYVDLSFDNNNANSLYDALVDVNTAGAIRRSESAMNSSAFQNIVESVDDRKLLVRRVKLYVNNVRKKSPFSDDTFATVAKRLNRLATIGVGQALGGILQPIKQVVPIAINTLINAGGLNVSSISNRSIQDFINKSGYAIASRGIESQAQIETLDKMIEQAATSRGGRVVEKIEAANKWWLKNFLVKFDVEIARASWITYYEQYLSKNGVDVSGIDYANHQISEEAADYAQRQVDRQQNVSDSDLSGAILSSKDPAKQLFTKILMPFASFRMNQSARLGSDISTLLNKTATKEDKKIAARSAAGFMAEMATFRAISYGSAMIIANTVGGLMDRDEDDEKEKKRKEAILKGQITSVVPDMFSPAPIVDKLVQLGVQKTLESAQDVLDIDKEDRVGIYSGNKQTFFQSLGLLGITAERASQLWETVSLSIDGEFTDEYGKRKKVSDKNMSTIGMLVPISILSSIGLAPTEASSIVRGAVKIAKSDAESVNKESKKQVGTNKDGLKELDPQLYNEIYGPNGINQEIKKIKEDVK